MDEISQLFYRERDALTLKDLACNRVALTVWRQEIINFTPKRKLPLSTDVVHNFNIQYTNSSIPPHLRKKIDECIPRIRKELVNWVDRAHRYFCSPDVLKRDTWIKYFDELVWRDDDFSIDEAETCLNLLRSDRLSRKEKFALACLYCLEDHIRGLWTEDLCQDNVHPWVLRYWNNRMKNPPCVENISNAFNANEMIRNRPVNPWIIDHFWPYTSSKGQFEAVHWLLYAADHSCLRHMLSKLNETALQKILHRAGAQLVKFFIKNEKWRPWVLPFWNHVKDSFGADQFLKTIKWMLRGAVGHGYNHMQTFRRMSEDEITLGLLIWTSAPQQLKDHVIQTYSLVFDYYMLEDARFTINDREPYRDLRLLKMILSEASLGHRYRLWTTSWVSFCLHAKKSDMYELIELCLPDANDRTQFKSEIDIMNDDATYEYCFSLLHNMEFDKFNDFLEFCSADPVTGIELKHVVLNSCLTRPIYGRRKLYFEDIGILQKAIEKCLPADPERASRFRKEFLSSDDFSNRLVERMQDGEFSAIKKAVMACLPSEQDRLGWKQQFTPRCRQCLTSLSFRQFSSSQWQDFMMWCLGRESKVAEFKRKLNFDDVLNAYVQRGETKEARRFRRSMSKLLKWGLDSKGLAVLKRRYQETDNEKIRALLFAG